LVPAQSTIEFKPLSCHSGPIRRTSDLIDRFDRVTKKVKEVVHARRCVILHERKGRTISQGVVYRDGSADGQPEGLPGQTFCGPPIDIEQYLGCFAISEPLDHAFQWRDLGSVLPAQVCLPVRDVASYMQGGQGVAACVRSGAQGMGQVATIFQLECSTVSTHLALLVNFMALHLHSILTYEAFEAVQPEVECSPPEASPGQQSDVAQVRLTGKERDVIKWVTEGKTAWEIGKILSVSERTVKFHLTNVYGKLNVSNRAQAVAKVSRLGLI
jgi:LuxR family quorum-sensing system transcriptional regulator SolR